MSQNEKRVFSNLVKILTRSLYLLPEEVSHRVALEALKIAFHAKILHLFKLQQESSKRVKILNLDFPNRIGLAAGMDKNGDYIDALSSLGFGSLEIGTVTPKAQSGNIKPRLFRLKKENSLINRMGFNNKGVDYLVSKIKKRKSDIILGVSIGKNALTPLERSFEDYLFCFKKLYPYADYLVANISSPNTKNLRKLETKEYFSNLLTLLKKEKSKQRARYGYKPLLVKLSPDLDQKNQEELAKEILDKHIDGIVCFNTTNSHNYSIEGGLSGQSLFELSTKKMSDFKTYLGKSFPIIASGGVMGKEHLKTKIEAGADLIQIYTGMIFEGPGIVNEMVKYSQKLEAP